jgi:hypothetical protein
VSSLKYKILKNSDLFLEFSTLLIALQGVCISSELILTGTINHKQGDWLTIEANHLDLRIRLPLVGPIQAALANSSPEFMEIEVIQGRDKDVEFLHTTSGFQKFVNSIFLPFLVSYFEKNKIYISTKFPAGRDTWPDAWQMGWAVRNASSHNGSVFTKTTTKPIHWNGLRFSPNDEPHKNILSLVNGGDILVLMLEMEKIKANL